jgi:hypothetical protein
MQIKMKINKFKSGIIFCILFLFLTFPINSEIMILSGCKNVKDGFIKNEYILNLKKLIMVRNYIYNKKTYNKYKITDLSVKKENSIEKFIYKDKDLILTDKVGYPQFYTQLIFKRNSSSIRIKTVINGEEGISKMSTCDKVELYENES